MKIFISKTILNNEEIDDTTLATYVALRSIYDMEKPIKYVTDNMLCYELFGNTSFTKYTKQAIKRGLDNLLAMNLITITESIGKSEWIVDMTNLHISDDEYYVILTDTEVHTIFGADKVDKFLLLRYFACLIGTIDYNSHVYIGSGSATDVLNNFVGYMTIKYISSLARVPEKTAVTYNEMLESLELVYIYRHEKYNVENGEIRSFSNHYGRHCHAEYIRDFALQYETAKGEGKTIIDAKKDANARRSLTQRYNAFIDGADYTEDEVLELYAHILQHNDKYQKIIDGSLDAEVIERAEKQLKDTSKFEEYFGLAMAI